MGFWDRVPEKLGVVPPTTYNPPPGKAVQYQPPTPTYRPAPVQQRENETFGEAIHDDSYRPTKQLQSMKQDLGRCPECGSNNYLSRGTVFSMALREQVPVAPECFDCGYKGSNAYYHEAGAAQPGEDAPVRQARGDIGTGFHGDTIIGRV